MSMCSRSIKAAARSGSHLYIETILRCARYDDRYTACEPVAWKSGTASSVAG